MLQLITTQVYDMFASIFNFRALCIRSPQELLLVISTRGEVFFLFSADRS